jgi:hypothetical protein
LVDLFKSKGKVRPKTVSGGHGYVHFRNHKGRNLLLPVITKRLKASLHNWQQQLALLLL